MAAIGFIVLAAAAYGILRVVVHAVEAIVHMVIEIVEITAITTGSIAAVVLFAIITAKIVRHRRRQLQQAGLKVLSIDLAKPPIVASSGPGKKPLDPAELFAEAVANPDMDPRFVEQILRNALEGPRQ